MVTISNLSVSNTTSKIKHMVCSSKHHRVRIIQRNRDNNGISRISNLHNNHNISKTVIFNSPRLKQLTSNIILPNKMVLNLFRINKAKVKIKHGKIIKGLRFSNKVARINSYR